MFAKVFTQIFDSSLADDYQVRLVFEDFLKLADKSGVVDMTPEAIARRTNVPLEIVKKGIAALEMDDLRSRTPNQKGKRIIRLDEHRDWGWQIVNFLKYRESATKEMLRMGDAERKKAFRKRLKLPPNPPELKTQSTEAEADMSHVSPDASGRNEEKPLVLSIFETSKITIGRAFKRKPDAHWGHDEESQLFTLTKRPEFKTELDEILIFKVKDPKYFPQSVSRLLTDWQPTLDRARNFDERNHANNSKPNGIRPNPRNDGCHENTTDYEEVCRRKSMVKPVAGATTSLPGS